ncbi:MAG TPA: CHASE2 domain-containing protein [Polyangia bacterium]|jgi:adenylate cyclase|nr:CHASE2 domain-containing protein [Polyangia bacterium]
MNLRTALRRNRLVWGLAVGLAAALVVLLALPRAILHTAELKTLDARFRAFSGTRRPNPDVVLVAIDQKSINFYRRQMQVGWPWPRSFYQILVDYLAQGGARAIVFDMYFSEPSSDTKETDGAEADADFGAAIARAGTVHLAAQLLADADAEQNNDVAPEARLLWPAQLSLRARPGVFHNAILPLAVLQAGAAGLGVVNHVEDEDEICRRVPLLHRFSDGFLPSLAYGAYATVSGKRSASPAALGIPLDGPDFLLTWYGPPGPTFPTYSAHALIVSAAKLRLGQAPDLAPSTFKNKLVIVGGMAAGLYDARNTPLAGQQPFAGMEIHATLLSNLLNREFLRPLDSRLSAAWTAILAVMVGLLFMRVRRQRVALPLIAVVLAGAVGVAFLVFRTRLLWLPIVEPLAAGSLSLVLAALFSFQIEGRRRRQVRSVFSRYLAPEVVRELLADPNRVDLGGKEVEATVFFSDVRDFTSISEKLPPQVLVGYLNQYFEAASQALLSRKALIDKYIGDSIMAVFGAPAEDPDHARNACLGALAMAELGRQAAAHEPDRPEFFTRMGLNSGRLVVGNVGSHLHLSYTAIGDNVNLASRLEGVNKQYGTQILISESTWRAAGDAIEAREVDFIQVKGKALPTRIYELVAAKGQLTAQQQAVNAAFAEALAAYRAQRWDAAIAGFGQVLQIAPKDGAAQVFLKRCETLRATALPTDWDGVYKLDTK